ncbi:MAG: phage major capsid protein [Reyranellaceae bacterium]
MDMTQLIAAFKQHADQTSAMLVELKSGMKELADWRLEQEKKAGRPNLGGGSGSQGALAKKVFESEAFITFKEGKAPNARIIVDAGDMLRKSIISDDYPLVPERVAEVITQPRRRVFLRQRMPSPPTDRGSIEFVRETFISNAGPQRGAESPVATFEGADKPESDFSWTPTEVKIGTFAHWVRASRQAISDIPSFVQMIEAGLIYGLEMEIENQLLNGTGGTGDMEGLLKAGNHTPYNGGYGAGHQAVDVVRRAITQLEVAGYEADITILNPLDWGGIELLKDSENRYLVGDPIGAALSNLWRRPVYTTPKLASGKFVVANLQQATAFWQRSQILIQFGFAEKDFIQNMTRILAENRGAQTVFRPDAVIYGNLTG